MEAERLRLQQLQTAHLYTELTILTWDSLHNYSGYGICDRMQIESTESADQRPFSKIKVLKSSTIAEVIHNYDKVESENCFVQFC